MLSVVCNLTAQNAQRQFNINEVDKRKSAEKLSSGYRINRAADDAAGLAISEKMRRQIRGLNQGASNIRDGISMVQVADGALDEISDMLHRVTELSVKASNDTLNPEDRQHIQDEISQISQEIQRVCIDTTYNELYLFDDPEYYKEDEAITKLVSCASADYGALHESYQSGGQYFPAAYVNFSGINESNIQRLNGGSFQFNCSQNCNEVFDITFTTDGTPSSCSNLNGRVHHYYSVDISDCKSGEEIVDKIYKYVSENLPDTSTGSSNYNPGGVKVSHSNNLIKDGNRMVIVTNYCNFPSKSEAESRYSPGKSGGVSCSTILAEPPKKFKKFDIQCSSNNGDIETIEIERISADILGTSTLDVRTGKGAGEAIDTVKKALNKVSEIRSNLGATQNRPEHSYNINLNTAENTQAAESVIRDTDMAKEMVSYSNKNILSQAGVAMMTQANQQNSTTLQLLG